MLELERELLKEKEEMERNLLREKEKIEEAKHLGLEYGKQALAQPQVVQDRAKAPKLPSFVDGKDDLDAYLWRIERFATTAKWDRTGWATKLTALLSGRALDVY